MNKPENLLYGVNDVPPHSVTLLNAVQHVGVISTGMRVSCAAAAVYPPVRLDGEAVLRRRACRIRRHHRSLDRANEPRDLQYRQTCQSGTLVQN
jgi:hypothetical protein